MKIHTLILFLVLFVCSCKNAGDRAKKAVNNNPHEMHGFSTGTADYCDSVNKGLINPDTMKSSPHRVSMATINGTHIHIEYGSPGVKDRTIWGGLVGYDQVWVTGAHNATTVQFSKPVIIGDTTIPKGTYALFTIPGSHSWIVMLNGRFEQHLADEYNEDEDLVRVNVIPEQSPMTQRLTYTIYSTGKQSGEISMQWEKLQINLPFKTTE